MTCRRLQIPNRLRDPSLILALVGQQVLVIFLLEYTQRTSAEEFSIPVAVCFTEVLKLATCIGVASTSAGWHTVVHSIRKSNWKLAIPSLLYVFQNQLVYIGAKNLPPIAFSTLSQLKTLACALFSKLLLKSPIGQWRGCALVILTVGVVLVIASQIPKVEEEEYHTRGVVAVLVACATSGFSSAFMEHVYKSSKNEETLWIRNAQLSLLSLPAITCCLFDRASHPVSTVASVFHSSSILALIFLQAIGGLLVGAIMKYMSAVVKCYASTLAICCCALLSRVQSPHSLPWQTLIGVGLVVSSIFMYGRRD